MQKAKLGVSVGLVGAALYFFGLFSGYLAMALLAGYILLVEEDAWLRKQAVRSVALLVCFSLLGTVIGLIPDFLEVIRDVVVLFEGEFSYGVVNKIVNLLRDILNFAEIIVFLLLGFKALGQTSIKLPVVDDLTNQNL